MTKLEAYRRLNQCLEQANAAVALLFSTDVMKGNKIRVMILYNKQQQQDYSEKTRNFAQN